MTLTLLDIFSGIGGFSLAGKWAGFTTIGFCEIEAFPLAVLRKHWPDAWIHDDVRTLTTELVRERTGYQQIDVLCGGFPCQDISCAGRLAGIDGERSGLWREMARLVSELRPQFLLVENTTGLLRRGMDHVLGDLARLRYDAEWGVFCACAAGASHARERVFIVAYAQEFGQRERGRFQQPPLGSETRNLSYWQSQPMPTRVAHGVPSRMDRLRALGNSVSPQVVYPILQAIADELAKEQKP